MKSVFNLPANVPTIQEPSVLALGTHETIKLETNRIEAVNKTIDLYPKCYNMSVRLIVHISGIENLANSGSFAATGGMNLSINMAAQNFSSKTGILFCDIKERSIEENGSGKGVLSRQFRSIGFPITVEVQKDLTLYLKLRNGDDFPVVKRNVTNIIRLAEDGVYEIEVGTGTSDDPIIQLPDVPGDNTQGPGIDAGVNDWGDEVITDIPV